MSHKLSNFTSSISFVKLHLVAPVNNYLHLTTARLHIPLATGQNPRSKPNHAASRSCIRLPYNTERLVAAAINNGLKLVQGCIIDTIETLRLD